jgi:hypothetical protein
MRRRRENFEFYDITNRISSAKTVFLKAFWSVFGVETHGNISKFSASGQDYDLKGEVQFFSHFQLELETGCPKTCSPAFRTFANTLVSDPLLIFVNTDVRSHVSDEIILK